MNYNLQHIINNIISYGFNHEGQKLDASGKIKDISILELNESLEYLKKKNFIEAEKCAGRSLFYNKENIKCYQVRVLARIGLEKYKDALDDINEILEREVHNCDAKNQHSRVCVLLENQKKFNIQAPNSSDYEFKVLKEFKSLFIDNNNSEEEENQLINFYKDNSYFINSLLNNNYDSNSNNSGKNNSSSNNNNNCSSNNSSYETLREEDKDEGLFWKVFGNKYLRNEIIEKIHNKVYERCCSDYKFGYRKKFSTITSIGFMVDNGLFELLKCKLKAGEKLHYGNQKEHDGWIDSIYDREILELILKKIAFSKEYLFERATQKSNYSLLDILFDNFSLKLNENFIISLFDQPNISILEYIVKKCENQINSNDPLNTSLIISDDSLKSKLLDSVFMNNNISDMASVIEFLIKYQHYFIDLKSKVKVEYSRFKRIQDEDIKKKLIEMNILELHNIVFIFPNLKSSNGINKRNDELPLIVKQISNHIRILHKYLLKESSSESVELKLFEATTTTSKEGKIKAKELSDSVKNLIMIIMESSKHILKDKLYIQGLCDYLVSYFNQFNQFIWDPVIFEKYKFDESDLFSNYNPGILNKILELKTSNGGNGMLNTTIFSSNTPIDSLSAVEFYNNILKAKNLRRFTKLSSNFSQFYDNIYKRSTLECFKSITTSSSDQIENFLHFRESFDYQKEKFIVDLILERKPTYFIKNTKEYNYNLVIQDKNSIDLILKFKHYYLNIEKYHLLKFKSVELISYFCEKHEVSINPTPFFMIHYNINIGRLTFKELMFNCKVKYSIVPSSTSTSTSTSPALSANDKSIIEIFSNYLYSTNYRFLSEIEYYILLKFFTYNCSVKIAYNKFPNQSINFFFEVFSSMNCLKLKQLFDHFSTEYTLYENFIDKSKYRFYREYDLDLFIFKDISCVVPIQIMYHFISRSRDYNVYFSSILNLLYRIMLQTSDITIKRLAEISFLLERYSCSQGSLSGFIYTFFYLHIKSPRLSTYLLKKMEYFKVTANFYSYIQDGFKCLDMPLFLGEKTAFISFFGLYVNDKDFPLKKIVTCDVQELFFALRNRLSLRYIDEYHLSKAEIDMVHLNDLEYLVDVYDVDSLKLLLSHNKFTDLIVQNKTLHSKIKQIVDISTIKYQKDDERYFSF